MRQVISVQDVIVNRTYSFAVGYANSKVVRVFAGKSVNLETLKEQYPELIWEEDKLINKTSGGLWLNNGGINLKGIIAEGSDNWALKAQRNLDTFQIRHIKGVVITLTEADRIDTGHRVLIRASNKGWLVYKIEGFQPLDVKLTKTEILNMVQKGLGLILPESDYRVITAIKGIDHISHQHPCKVHKGGVESFALLNYLKQSGAEIY